MAAERISPQEEDLLALLAVARLGEPTAHQVAAELGVATIRHTLGRLVDQRRLVRVRVHSPGSAGATVALYRLPAASVGAPTAKDTCHGTRSPSVA